MNEEYTIEKRIRGEICGFSGSMGIYADDLRGNIVEIDADTEFESASTIKSFI